MVTRVEGERGGEDAGSGERESMDGDIVEVKEHTMKYTGRILAKQLADVITLKLTVA